MSDNPDQVDEGAFVRDLVRATPDRVLRVLEIEVARFGTPRIHVAIKRGLKSLEDQLAAVRSEQRAKGRERKRIIEQLKRLQEARKAVFERWPS